MKSKDLRDFFSHWSCLGSSLNSRINEGFTENKNFESKNVKKKVVLKKFKQQQGLKHRNRSAWLKRPLQLSTIRNNTVAVNFNHVLIRNLRILFFTKIFSFIFKKRARHYKEMKYLKLLKKESTKLVKILVGLGGKIRKSTKGVSLVKYGGRLPVDLKTQRTRNYNREVRWKRNLIYQFKKLYKKAVNTIEGKQKRKKFLFKRRKKVSLDSFFEFLYLLTLGWKRKKRHFLTHALKFSKLFQRTLSISSPTNFSLIKREIRRKLNKSTKKLIRIRIKRSKLFKFKFINLYLQIECNVGGKNRIGFYDWNKNTIFSTNTKALGIKTRKLRVNLVKSCFLFLRVVRLFKSKAWELRSLKNYTIVTKSRFTAVLIGDVTKTYRLFRYLHARNKFMNFNYIKDSKRIPHNGCRLPKKRRKKNKGRNKYSKKNIFL